MLKKRIIQGNFLRSLAPVSNKEHVICHDTDNGRYYQIAPNVYYPSITTVLSSMTDLSGWIDHVGVESANMIKEIAAEKGNQIHELMENYLRNEPIDLDELMPPIRTSFLGAIPTLQRVNFIYNQETVLWSNRLKIAGRADLIGKFDDINSIIDFKGSNKPKKKENITHYFCQATAYREMYHELYGVKIDQIVILVFPENQREPQVFIENPDKYVPILERVRKNFKGEYHA